MSKENEMFGLLKNKTFLQIAGSLKLYTSCADVKRNTNSKTFFYASRCIHTHI